MAWNHQLDNSCRSYFRLVTTTSPRSSSHHPTLRRSLLVATGHCDLHCDCSGLLRWSMSFLQPLGSLTKSWGLEDWRWRILIIHVENWINSEDHIVWLTFLCGLHDFFGVGTKNIYKFTISKKIGFAIQKKLPKSPGTRSFSQHYGQVDHGHLAFASIGLASPSHLGEVEEGCWSWRMTPPTPHTIWVFP